MTSLRHNDADRSEPRDTYLDAARDCILDVGWRRTTLTEVARRAGVSRMTIYRTWADMPQLLADLMTREWGGVVADSLAEVDPDTPTVERLVRDIVSTVQRLRENEL
ncbi:MAG TPA: helix-turn-helix domain-containing protein, partial [Nocardioides sp.]|nr:helix-turn-helix domain-containing protein [Nocardioides sp.]